MRLMPFTVGSILAASAALAQDPVPSLEDLVGARAAGGETALENRGYTWVGTEKEGGDSYAYYRENENGQCIVVRTSDGRYASIAYAPAFDCEQHTQQASQGHPGKGFKTVCGVIVDGQTYRYKCRLVDHYDGDRKTHSVLHFPDQKLKMVWKPQNVVELHFEGMVPQTAEYVTYEGETNFLFEGKTYFYISDPGMAAMEVRDFQQQ